MSKLNHFSAVKYISTRQSLTIRRGEIELRHGELLNLVLADSGRQHPSEKADGEQIGSVDTSLQAGGELYRALTVGISARMFTFS